MRKNKYNSVIILGPTASGKSDIAISLAKRLHGEIINCDSMQIYSDLSIGTARPTLAEQEGVPHHLFGFIKPDEEYSVSAYNQKAVETFHEVKTRAFPVFVGGTGLYINSLLQPQSYGEAHKDEKFREKYYALAEEHGKEFVHEKLRAVDPQSAEEISVNNLKKVIRALEIFHLSNKTKSEIVAQDKAVKGVDNGIAPLVVGITLPREKLYERINLRVDKMIEKGLVEEARTLYDKGFSEKLQSISSIGYKEIYPYFRGEKSLDKCIEDIKQKTRNYAKRQITWFKKTENVVWFDVSEYKNIKKIVKEIMKKIKK